MIPILLLHGALGSDRQLSPLKQELEKGNRPILSLSFSGHSGVPFSSTFGIETFSQDVLSFLIAKNIPRVDIFGYSMGGYVAMWFAIHHPQRVQKIVTLGTKFDWSPESAKREIQKLDPEKILLKIPAFARILETRHAPNDWKELIHKTSAMMVSLGQAPLLTEETLRTFSHKTIIALGDEDDMADRAYSEKVSGLIGNGKFILLENTPHPIEKVDIEKIARIILQES